MDIIDILTKCRGFMEIIFFKLIASAVLSRFVCALYGPYLTIFTLHRSDPKNGAYNGTSAEHLDRCLRYAQRNKFAFASIDELVLMAYLGEKLKVPTLCFILDDGYEDQLNELVPVLLKYHAKPTFYVVTDLVDQIDWPWDAKLAHIVWNSTANLGLFKFDGTTLAVDLSTIAKRIDTRRRLIQFAKTLKADLQLCYLEAASEQFAVVPPKLAPDQYRPTSWERLRQFEAMGLRIGSHGQTHRTFSTLSNSEISLELAHANRRLAAEISSPSKVFCYPSGTVSDFSPNHASLVVEAGFLASLTAISRTTQLVSIKNSPFYIHRIAMPKKFTAFVRYASWLEYLRDKLGEKMTRYSIFGYYGQGNAGDEAILAGLIDGIRANSPNSRLAVYSDSPLETEILHGVDAYTFFPLSKKSIFKSLLSSRRLAYLRSTLNFLKTDVVIVGGGGLFFDTPETNRWLMGYVKLIKLSKRFGKKVAVLGVSVGPFHHETSGPALTDAFAVVDMVSVRDMASRDLLIKCGLCAEKIMVIPDVVFTFASAPSARIDEILVAENLSFGSHKNIALTPCSYNSREPKWLEQYVAFCERAVTELGVNLWFIPMQRGTLHDDLDAIREICAAVNAPTRAKIQILDGHYSAREIQGVIGRADFVFAERLHGSIMAINSQTQFLSIAYMPKVAGVLTQAKLYDRAITMEAFLSGVHLNSTLLKIKKFLAEPTQVPVVNNGIKHCAHQNFSRLIALSSVGKNVAPSSREAEAALE